MQIADAETGYMQATYTETENLKSPGKMRPKSADFLNKAAGSTKLYDILHVSPKRQNLGRKLTYNPLAHVYSKIF